MLSGCGQAKTLPHPSVVAEKEVATSLMPAGLDAAFKPQELLDLVAWLRSLR